MIQRGSALLFSWLMITSFQVQAQDFQVGISKADLNEWILAEVLPLSLGDDGEECWVELSETKVLFDEAKFLQLDVTGLRDSTQPGCFPESIDCTVIVEKSPRGKMSLDYVCR